MRSSAFKMWLLTHCFLFNNQHEAGEFGFVYQGKYVIGFIKVSEHALDFSGSLVGVVGVAASEDLFEEGLIKSG